MRQKLKRALQITLIILLTTIAQLGHAQVFADFETPETTPDLTTTNAEVVDNPDKAGINISAKSGYYLKPGGNWHYFVMEFDDTVKIGKNNNLKFKVHQSLSGRVYVKFWKSEMVLIEDWAHEYNALPETATWVELQKDLSSVKGEWFTKLEVACLVDNESTANVYLDDFELEEIVLPTPLKDAVAAGYAFKNVMVEGADYGQFPAGSMTLLSQALTNADTTLSHQDELSDEEIVVAANNLNDTLIIIESSAVKHENTLIDTLASYQTVILYRNLAHIGEKGYQLFGNHDATAYGISEDGTGWADDATASKSDIKVLTGSHGAISSYDASEIVQKSYVELEKYRNRLIANYNEGGVNTICWHMDDPKYGSFYWTDIAAGGEYNVVASLLSGGTYYTWYKDQLELLGSFFKGLRGANGESVPVIFRPFHEHNGSWFWWGATRCSPQEYNELWQFTLHYLRDTLHVHNLIYAFSPDGGPMNSKEDYFSIYPGDNYMDVFGMDDYYFNGSESERDEVIENLTYLIEHAENKGKLPAFTETGLDKIPVTNWYTERLLAAINHDTVTRKIAYVATWRNASTDHHYVPYPGHEAVPDFLKFYDDTSTLFLNDLTGIYDTLLTDGIRTPSTSSRINYFGFEDDEGSLIAEDAVYVAMPENSDLENLTANFELSQGAVAKIGNIVQQSGTTSNNFTNPVNYTVIAQSGTDSAIYSVMVEYSQLQSITLSPKTVFVDAGSSYQFTAEAYNQMDFKMNADIDWTVSGGGTIDEDGTFTAESSGTHYVYAFSDEIIDSAKVIVPGETSILSTDSQNLLVYPNPADTYVLIKSDYLLISVELINVLGQRVLVKSELNQTQYRINTANVLPGIYILKVKTASSGSVETIHIK